MPWELEDLHKEYGMNMATHVWNTTLASFAFIAAPSTGRQIVLRELALYTSSPASIRLTNGTAAATTHWILPGSGTVPVNLVEPCRIVCDDGNGLVLHSTAGVGNGYLRVWYTIQVNTGSNLSL